MTNNPFLTSLIVMIIAFALGHIIPARLYKAGKKATMLGGIFFALLAFFFFYTGFKNNAALWQTLFGLCAGISFWIFYGEILETLQSDFGFKTGVHIGYSNWPVLIAVGILIGIKIYWLPQNNFTIDAFFIAFFGTWFFHVVLLTIYYAPVFGGNIVEKGESKPAIKVWSNARITTAIATVFVFILLAIRAVISMPNTVAEVVSGFLVVILAWSIIMEIPKKLFTGWGKSKNENTAD